MPVRTFLTDSRRASGAQKRGGPRDRDPRAPGAARPPRTPVAPRAQPYGKCFPSAAGRNWASASAIRTHTVDGLAAQPFQLYDRAVRSTTDDRGSPSRPRERRNTDFSKIAQAHRHAAVEDEPIYLVPGDAIPLHEVDDQHVLTHSDHSQEPEPNDHDEDYGGAERSNRSLPCRQAGLERRRSQNHHHEQERGRTHQPLHARQAEDVRHEYMMTHQPPPTLRSTLRQPPGRLKGATRRCAMTSGHP